MFGFGNRKQSATPDQSKVVGIDLNATRAQAVSSAVGRGRVLKLDDASDELPLFINLDGRTPEVGSVGVEICRKLPHLVCSNFLPQLGHARQWQVGRSKVTPESALLTTFEKICGPVGEESQTTAISLPTYLTPAQVKTVLELGEKAKLPLRGSVVAPLAVAAHRAAWILGGTPPEIESSERDGSRPDWVVPIRRQSHGNASIVIVDVDEFALTASVIRIEPNEVKLVTSAAWPRASLKLWKDRLLDSLSDRCVRLCRRDPRDSADAEQSLYLQLDAALDRVRAGQPVVLNIRSEHWYQDLVHQADEFDGYCANLAKLGTEGVAELIHSANLPAPPRAVWLTHTAAKLPGLAATIYNRSAEQTEVLALPIHAYADATASLVSRWLTGKLPRGHLDLSIPLERNPYTRALPEHRSSV